MSVPMQPPQAPVNFDIEPSAILSEVESVIKATDKVWDDVAKISPQDATFETAIIPLIRIDNAVRSRANFLCFFDSCSPKKELREVAEIVTRMMSQASTSRLANEQLFKVIDAVYEKERQSLGVEHRVYLNRLRNEFVDTGLDVADPAARARVKEILKDAVDLQRQHISNLDGDLGGVWFTRDELDGVDPDKIATWKSGGDKVFFKHNVNTFTMVMKSAIRAQTRYKAWSSFENRAAGLNQDLLKTILLQRDEMARQRGFRHYGDLREHARIRTTAEIQEYLDKIRDPLKEAGKHELEYLKALKKKHLQEQGISADADEAQHFYRWDSFFYSERARQASFNLDSSKVAEYFPCDRSLGRMLQILSVLFAVRFEARDSISTWHEDVSAYEVWNNEPDDKGFLGYLYLDLFPRDFKYGHKGHYKLQPGYTKEDGTRHHPASCIMANYSPPSATKPSLLPSADVVSLFHELGHAIHSLVSKTETAALHGSATPRDFCEMPSIMLEHVFWDAGVLRMVSGKYDTGKEHGTKEEKLPDAMIEQLVASRFQFFALSALGTVHLSMFDQLISAPPSHEALESMNFAKEFNSIVQDLTGYEGDTTTETQGWCRYRFPIGYAATYYTYIHSTMISYDIFETKFRSLMTPNKDAKTAEELFSAPLLAAFSEYRHAILKPGAAVESYYDLLESFMGKPPTPDAYMSLVRAAKPKTLPL